MHSTLDIRRAEPKREKCADVNSHNLQGHVHPTYRHRSQTNLLDERHVRCEHHRAQPLGSWSSPLRAAQGLHFACRFSLGVCRLAEPEVRQDVCPGPGPRHYLRIASSQVFAQCFQCQQSVHTQELVEVLCNNCQFNLTKCTCMKECSCRIPVWHHGCDLLLMQYRSWSVVIAAPFAP